MFAEENRRQILRHLPDMLGTAEENSIEKEAVARYFKVTE
jgi:hypothetical protein